MKPIHWITSTALIAVLSAPAFAQAPAASAGGEDMGIPDIVVTAQKREERLQDVPVAISAFSTSTLEQIGATRAADIGRLVPNLAASPTPSSTSTVAYSIRGIGQVEPLLTMDPGVGVYIDGVYVARQTGGAFQLADIERIEVLRGPQGTLYGRNTTGGAINVVTKSPTGEFGIRATAGYGNFDNWRGLTTINLPRVGPLSVKLSYLHQQNDGYVRNRRVPGVNYAVNSFGDENIDAVAVAAKLDLSDRLTAEYRFDFTDSVGVPAAQQLIYASPAFQGLLNASIANGGTGIISPNRLGAISADTAGLDHNRSYGHSLTVDWKLADRISLKSITALRHFKNRLDGSDLDGNSLLIGNPPSFYTTFAGINDRRQKQFSQEIQLLGSGDWGNFIGGLYYFRESGSEFNQQRLADPGNGMGGTAIPGSPGPGAIVNLPLDYNFVAKSAAAFGQVTVHVTPKLDLTAGGRYTEDRRSVVRRLYGNYFVLPNPLASFARDAKYKRFNYTATADYSFTRAIHAYARISSAFKSGGFNPRASNPDFYAFGPEKLTAYEVGLKSELFDRRLQANIALFQNDYDDLQVNQFEGIGGATARTLNAGKARFRGVEVDLAARVTPELTLNAGLGILDPKYKSFLYRDPATGIISDVADTARFTNAPKTTANMGLDYVRPVGDMKLTVHLDESYRSRIYFTPVSQVNDVSQSKGYWLTNGRVALSDIAVGGSKVEVAVWGKNLFNKNYRVYAVDFGSAYSIATFGMPRSYGVEATFRY